ncbi:carbohydrate ABC transporter permease [Teichococcus aestuarii]|uniref:carbohydrate ABC transporter permease n=1 Tax=Teichococcus aestuarii TaxID=568898 RepID=UPI0036157DDE
MSATTLTPTAAAQPRLRLGLWLETLAAWTLALAWAAPLLYALWAAIHPTGYATRFELFAPLTLDNFAAAWNAAPFPRYMLNSVLLVTFVTGCQFVLGTLAAFVFARSSSRWAGMLFAIVLVQLMIMPDMLIVENYRTMRMLGLVDTVVGIGLPYVASAFGIFLLRQTFKQVPKELEDAARIEGCRTFGILWKVYVPLARPTYGLRPYLRLLPLEQLPLAAGHHQHGGDAAADRGPRRLCFHGPGHRLGHHQRGDAADLGATAARLPPVPAAVRAVLHAGRHPLSPHTSGDVTSILWVRACSGASLFAAMGALSMQARLQPGRCAWRRRRGNSWCSPIVCPGSERRRKAAGAILPVVVHAT